MTQAAISADELLSDSREVETPKDPITLQELRQLGAELRQLESEAQALEERLASKNKQINYLKSSKLPGILLALKLKDFTLDDGSTIALAQVVSGKITDEYREEAHGWLREHDHGDLIKNELKATFGKGEDEYAKQLVAYIREQRDKGVLKVGSVDLKEQVHAQTLLAFLRQQLEAGAELPARLFNLDVFHVVKFKTGKGSK